ncbi:MAG: PfkB family carbohydrate kinase, partial [Planctomycetota bacterium]|nr:PfkB family carbohydrate kinase [Planctomycetota bacterium]
MPGQVAVVGSANIDLVMTLPHLPRKGESVTAGSFSRTFGGKGSNQAVAARRARAGVTAVFNLGDDADAGRLLETYREEGLDVARIRLNPGEACGTAIILVDGAGDNTIAIFPGANGSFRPDQVDEAAEDLRGADLVMLQMEVADSVNRRAIELAGRGGAEVMLNFAP